MPETPPDATGNSGGAKRRRPQTKLTNEDKAALVAILNRPDARVDGKIHIPTVEKLTGLTYGAIYNFIRSDRYWHAQVGEADVGKLQPGEHDQVDGRAPAIPAGVNLTDQQFKEYQALVRQADKLARCDWVALGMTQEAADRMKHYQTLGSAPVSGILGVATGQLFSNLELLDRIVKADSERVLTGRLPTEVDKNGDERDAEEVERDWRYMVYSGMKLQLEMFSHLHRTQAMMARVMRELRDMDFGKKNGEKGVFNGPASVSERQSDRE